MLVIDLLTAASVQRREKWAAAMKDLMPKKPQTTKKKSPQRTHMFLKTWQGGMLRGF